MLELIGRYRIHEQIGEGAMADVYRAHDPHIDRSLAIKVLKAEFRDDHEYAARFLREARAAGALSHPGIVTVFDVGESDGYPFIVMELLDGEPLSERLRRGALPPSEVIAIGVQLCQALSYAHGQGVIHRDIKPSNIVISPDGRTLKLLDFGIAQLADVEPGFEAASYRTQIGQVIGTPRYMSPEQTLGREMDARADIYSVGVVLYEMLSGERAFPGGSAATLAAQIVNTDPRPLAEAAPRTPRGLQFIVHKAMAKQPAQRFSSAAQMAEALRRELSVAAVVAKEAAQERQFLSFTVRQTLLLALVTTLVLAATVGTILVRQREAMRGVALSAGAAVTAFVANNAALRAADNAALPPEERDWLPVQAFVKNASSDRNVRTLTVADAGGIVRAATDPTLIGRPYRGAGRGERAIGTRDGIVITAREHAREFRFVRPILYAGRNFGTVDLLLDQQALRSAASLSRWLLAVMALVVLASVALAAFFSARRVEAPLGRLRGALLELARGNVDFRLSHNRRDEFGQLFDDVNLVAQTMGDRLNAVEALVLDTPVPDDAAAAAVPPPPIAAAATGVTARHDASAGPFASPTPVAARPEWPAAPVDRLNAETIASDRGGTEGGRDEAALSAAHHPEPPPPGAPSTADAIRVPPPWARDDEDEDRTLIG